MKNFTTLILAIAITAGALFSPSRPAEAASADVGVDVLNELRGLSGLPRVASDAGMRSDSAKHSQYMVRTGTISHHEDPKSPHYTSQGDRAARESNLKVSSSSALSVRAAVQGLMAAPFHGVGLIDPRLRQSGGAMHNDPDASRWRSGYTINVIRGRGSLPSGTNFPIVWPGNGSTVAINRYPGSETPDPLTACPGWSAPTGLPLLVQFAGDEPIQSATVHGPDGAAMGVCAFDRHTYRNPDASFQNVGRSTLAARNAAVIIPRNPLTHGRHTIEVRTNKRTVRWQFTVGDANLAPNTQPVKQAEPVKTAEQPVKAEAEAPVAPSTKQPRVRSIDNACPESSTPDASYRDVPSGTVHARAISCATWWQVALGDSAGRYNPTGQVTRAQMAAFIARMITESGGELPAIARPRFLDVVGSPHAQVIHQLAEVGIVTGDSSGRYRPSDPVTRAQMATFLARSYEYRSGQRLPAETGWFHDTDSSSHATNIDKLATGGFAGGTAPGTYNPGAPVRREAMAAFVSRVLDLLVEQHSATRPTA